MIKLRRRLTMFLIALFLVIIIGMIGFFVLKTDEGGAPTLIDAFAWTIMTLSTLGSYTIDTTLTTYYGKLFTSIVVVMGISVFFIGTPLLIAPWLEKKVAGAIKQRPLPVPEKDHVVICGYGEIIDEVIDTLRLHNVEYVVIEKDESKSEKLRAEKKPFIYGDPTIDEVLKKANVENAIALIAAMDDETNSFICLSTRSLYENLRIISIAEKAENARAMYIAGANRIVTPKILAGSLLGRRASKDVTIGESRKFTMFGDIELRQFEIPESSPIAGMPLQELHSVSEPGAIVIGLWKEDGLHLNPSPDNILEKGTTALVIGTENHLTKLESLLEEKNE